MTAGRHLRDFECHFIMQITELRQRIMQIDFIHKTANIRSVYEHKQTDVAFCSVHGEMPFPTQECL